jgi:hypothetical protein
VKYEIAVSRGPWREDVDSLAAAAQREREAQELVAMFGTAASIQMPNAANRAPCRAAAAATSLPRGRPRLPPQPRPSDPNGSLVSERPYAPRTG